MSAEDLQRMAAQMLDNNMGSSDGNQPPTLAADKTRKGEKFDLLKVDYAWVDRCDDKRELRLAYEALEEDSGFPDLTAHCLKKLKSLDKRFKTAEDFNRYDPEEERRANEDVSAFLSEMAQTDQRLRDSAEDAAGDKENRGENHCDFLSALQRKKKAEEERLKGNEYMKGKEYDEAVACYTRSLELFPDDAACYSNRAMAFLKLKRNGSCIEDAERCLALDPAYLKAYHRRGKAYLACGQYEDAIKDFQYILEREPDNKDINASLKEARNKIQDREHSEQRAKERKEEEAAEKKFKRVSIEESSDEEEQGETAKDSEEPTITTD